MMEEKRYWCPTHKYQWWGTDEEVEIFGICKCPICDTEMILTEPLFAEKKEGIHETERIQGEDC